MLKGASYAELQPSIRMCMPSMYVSPTRQPPDATHPVNSHERFMIMSKTSTCTQLLDQPPRWEVRSW